MTFHANRRQFLLTSATAVGLASTRLMAKEHDVKIDRIDVWPVMYPTRGYFKFLTDARGVQGRTVVFVKVTADNGQVGWGQSIPSYRWSYETLETVTIVLREYFAPALIGRSVFDLEGAQKSLDSALAGGFSTAMPIARAGLDIALHDLLGKLSGKSLAELWGRQPGGRITLSWTLNPRRLDEIDALVDAGRARGFRHFNIKVAPDPKFDIAMAQQVRRLAPEAFLWADANGGYDPATALDVAPKLADAGVDVLEAPLKPNRIRGYQALKRQGALPILMDEAIVSPLELDEFIHLRMLDGAAIKLARCGGLTSARRQIELIERHDLMWLGSGLTDPDISLAATLILFGAYGLTKPAALNGPQFLDADVLAQPLRVENGTLKVPTGAGLGVEVDEAKVAELVRATKRSGGDK